MTSGTPLPQGEERPTMSTFGHQSCPKHEVFCPAVGQSNLSLFDLRQMTLEIYTMQTLDFLDKKSLRDDVPAFGPGDTLNVHVKIVEGKNHRIQVFKGFVVGRQGAGVRETFTVRKVSFGVGVERTFPVHSPSIEKIEVVTRGDVRRAKLYYMRDRHGKAARIREKREF